MRSFSIFLLFCAACIGAGFGTTAQERRTTTSDPRVGLKAGLRDAGVAARNMELVKSISKPEGFFDPKSPLGTPTPAEQNGTQAAKPEREAQARQRAASEADQSKTP